MHAHQALEDLLVPRLRQINTPGDYVRLLKTFYGFFHPLEALIGQYLSSGQLPDLKQRRKAAFLLEDIAALGYPADHLSLSTHLPTITNEAQAWGALYVLEGSTLGGRGITRMMRKQCPQLRLQHLSFFNGYGEATGPMWVLFQEALNILECTESCREQTVAAANDTFLNFKRWIEETLA